MSCGSVGSPSGCPGLMSPMRLAEARSHSRINTEQLSSVWNTRTSGRQCQKVDIKLHLGGKEAGGRRPERKVRRTEKATSEKDSLRG